jgi:hypothetical protein
MVVVQGCVIAVAETRRLHGRRRLRASQVLDGRKARRPVFDDLNRYQATMHFNGQSMIALDGDGETGESCCVAHHLFTDDGVRKLMLSHLRYADKFVKLHGAWLFAQRNLYVDWIETKSSCP